MQTPSRLLRAAAIELDPAIAHLTPRQAERQARILRLAQDIFVRFGRHTITFTALATAMKMATATLRKHFTCLDALLTEILSQHLQAVAAACGQVPRNAPNRPQAARAAYLAATRTAAGAFTDAHRLFVQQRQTLPPDLLEHIETIYQGIGELLGGPSSAETLAFLDNPNLDAPRIETLLATYAATRPQTAPQPPPNRQPIKPLLPLDTATLTACLRRTTPPPQIQPRQAYG